MDLILIFSARCFMNKIRLTFLCSFLFAVPLRADIVLDFSHAGSFFAGDSDALAAVQAAANDINTLISTSLNAVTQDTVEGINGSTNLELDYSWSYTNPSTGAAETITNVSMPANTTRIYVGMRNLTGSTLGQAGVGGFGVNFTGGGIESEWAGAVAAAESAGNAVHLRGGGPVTTSFSQDLTLGSTTATINLQSGSNVGHLWFDSDTNNDSVTDSAVELAAAWHYDHTASVTSGKDDLYSVALHEMLHALAYGSSDSWDANVSGTDWTGTEAIAEHGTGTGLIDSGGAHLASGILSPRLSDGVVQEVVMDPNLTTGTRKYLTELDAAVLRDIGWNTTAIPEPSAFACLGVVAGVCFARRFWPKK